jgi:hypothetical protein
MTYDVLYLPLHVHTSVVQTYFVVTRTTFTRTQTLTQSYLLLYSTVHG